MERFDYYKKRHSLSKIKRQKETVAYKKYIKDLRKKVMRCIRADNVRAFILFLELLKEEGVHLSEVYELDEILERAVKAEAHDIYEMIMDDFRESDVDRIKGAFVEYLQKGVDSTHKSFMALLMLRELDIGDIVEVFLDDSITCRHLESFYSRSGEHLTQEQRELVNVYIDIKCGAVY